MGKQYNLRNSYEVFLKNQLHIMKPTLSMYDTEAGNDFINFILNLLPNLASQQVTATSNDIESNYSETLKNGWNKQASWWAYEESFPNYYIGMSLIMAWIKKINKPSNILSVGSGPGIYELFLENKFSKDIDSIFCTDVASGMLEEVAKNQQRYKSIFNKESQIKIKTCRAESLPFSNESMDVIISNKVLHWCENKKDALFETRRVLKRGGLGMFIVANHVSFIDFLGISIPISDHINPVQLGAFLFNLNCHVLDYKQIRFDDPFGQNGERINHYAILFQKK